MCATRMRSHFERKKKETIIVKERAINELENKREEKKIKNKIVVKTLDELIVHYVAMDANI